MKQSHKKDFYSILGVDANASAEAIRNAYLSRTRVIHPDRFDSERQSQDWKKANEMLVELNEAYTVLRDRESKEEYDQLHTINKQRHTESQPPKEQPFSTSFEHGELTAGSVSFDSLPQSTQARLRKRQENTGVDQFQVSLTSVQWNYIFIIALFCWFGYLFANVDGVKWNNETLIWYGSISLTAGLLIGRNIVTILRYTKTNLKPYFYVTPVYFIKTEYDIVTFYPIWTLKDYAVTHNYRNGAYVNSNVVLKFDAYNESLNLSSKLLVESLFDSLNKYDVRLRSAYASNNMEYFRNNDDFYNIPRSGHQAAFVLPRGKRILIYSLSVSLCLLSLIISFAVNDKLSSRRWVRHQEPTTYEPPTPQQPVSKPSHPEKPLPNSGKVRTYSKEEKIAPFEIKAAQGNHFLVKLVDASTHAQILTVFVRSGTTVEIDVPLGTYEVRYASGEHWYGYEYLFGEDTYYSKADKKFAFEKVDNKISGYTITLFKVANGNLQTSTINPTDF